MAWQAIQVVRKQSQNLALINSSFPDTSYLTPFHILPINNSHNLNLIKHFLLRQTRNADQSCRGRVALHELQVPLHSSLIIMSLDLHDILSCRYYISFICSGLLLVRFPRSSLSKFISVFEKWQNLLHQDMFSHSSTQSQLALGKKKEVCLCLNHAQSDRRT